MMTFQVWIRPIDDFCRIRVRGFANARWLSDRLSAAFVFRTFEPMEEEAGTACWIFRIPYNPPLSRAGFRRLLKEIPEVELMPEPG
jgi:hypothetical protein